MEVRGNVKVSKKMHFTYYYFARDIILHSSASSLKSLIRIDLAINERQILILSLNRLPFKLPSVQHNKNETNKLIL